MREARVNGDEARRPHYDRRIPKAGFRPYLVRGP